MGFDSQVLQDLGDDRFRKQTAKLDAVIERNTSQSQKPHVAFVFIEFDQKASLVLL